MSALCHDSMVTVSSREQKVHNKHWKGYIEVVMLACGWKALNMENMWAIHILQKCVVFHMVQADVTL